VSWLPVPAPPVMPCRPKRYYEDPDYDYIDITCDGKDHDFRYVKGGQHVKTLWRHQECHRFTAHADAWMRQKFREHDAGRKSR
jgi:hypothetical protein